MAKKFSKVLQSFHMKSAWGFEIFWNFSFFFSSRGSEISNKKRTNQHRAKRIHSEWIQPKGSHPRLAFIMSHVLSHLLLPMQGLTISCIDLTSILVGSAFPLNYLCQIWLLSGPVSRFFFIGVWVWVWVWVLQKKPQKKY